MSTVVTRLHIRPLDADLLPIVLGPEITRLASDVSYHSIQTFPENNYGFVNLPRMEAEKVKKKVNGAILRGRKVKIEEARPKKRKHREGDSNTSEESHKKDLSYQQSTKAKEDKNVLMGHEIGSERCVKRGWTQKKTDASTKKRKITSTTKPQAASKYTEKEELLFKTIVPKNKAVQDTSDVKKKRSKGSDSMVVHEFGKTTAVPTFLRVGNSDRKLAVAYEDGSGWIDEQGAVVEREAGRGSKPGDIAQQGILGSDTRGGSAHSKRSIRNRPNMTISVPDRTSTSSKYSRGEVHRTGTADKHPMDEDETSSADSSSAEETSSAGTSGSSTDSEGVSASDVDTAMDATDQPTEATKPKPPIHPLEALFKKPSKPASSRAGSNSQDVAKPSLEVQTTFSFFETQQDDDSLPPIPMTPFSSQDLRTRVVRSAAPTPDTAHPSRMSSLLDGESSEGDLSEMEDHDPVRQVSASAVQGLTVSQTDFEKQFWEKRGENNRAWKARRRTVLKEKRQRENRVRRPRNW